MSLCSAPSVEEGSETRPDLRALSHQLSMRTITAAGAIGVIIGAIIVGSYALTHYADAMGQFVLPAIQASKATRVTVGPQSNIQVLASSSRSYARITRDTLNAAVYCNMNGDRHASTTVTGGVSFKLSTSSGETYEIYQEKNPYDGAVRCTATASTTVIVHELKVR